MIAEKRAVEIVPGDRVRMMALDGEVRFVRWFEDHPQGMGYFVVEKVDIDRNRIEHRTITMYQQERVITV